jgi:Flp pilus assembly protein TadG
MLGRRSGRPAAPGRQRGQVLVIFAVSVVGLCAAAGIAFDIGRFYAEQRFLQNAADAAALAAANALTRGETVAVADAEARAVLARNFSTSPNGSAPAQPPTTPAYAPGFAGTASQLVNGILITGSEVRVAVQSTIPYTFGRVVGLVDNTMMARARTRTDGDLLPIAVRRFVNMPGPNSGVSAPCPSNPNLFTDFFATAATACLGTDTNGSLRTTPSPGSAFDATNPGSDPTNHGPVMTILGQGAQPSDGADFRGFVALDIRNFSTSTSQLYYNGVSSGTTRNQLKDKESGWIRTGYPGPAFPPATTPPDPNDQVAAISGNDTGIAIDALADRYAPGDEILVAVYPGIVMQIPDFTISPPATINLPTTGHVDDAATFRVSRNNAFSGQVSLSTVADLLDPANPMVTGAMDPVQPVDYDPSTVTPSLGAGTPVVMDDIDTNAATPGIYTLWIRGEAGSPYLTVKHIPFAINVGGVERDFAITSSVSELQAANAGDAVSLTLTLKKSGLGSTFGGTVSLSLDGPLPTGLGSVTFGAASVTPTGGTGASTTLTINTGTVAPGTYDLRVRATGLNGDATPRKVTHVLPLRLRVGAVGSSGSRPYVDITGFAVMRVAYVDPNRVDAYAITGVYADQNDPALRRGQVARLVPWN